jgi:hypothetical protein
VRVVDDTSGATQWEVSAAVNKRGALVASWVDMRAPGERCGYSSSRDGGATWSKNEFRINPKYNIAADPVVVADANGDFYMVCMSVGSGYNGGILEVARSTDDGLTWGPWVNAFEIPSSGFPDKPWMAAYGSGKLYMAWEDYISGSSFTRVRFTRSLDAGATWSPAVNLSAGGSWAELGTGIDTDAAGNVFISWAGYSQKPVYFVKSSDEGSTFTPQVKVGDNPMDTTISSLAVDPTGQHVYVVWNSAYSPQGVRISHSGDSGATWSAYRELSTTGNKVALDVDPLGTVHVIYEEDGTPKASVWYTHSKDNGTTFSTRTRVPEQATGCGSGTAYGSYEALVADSQAALHSWWCDTRGGEADIYYAKTGPQVVVTRIEVSPPNATVAADATQQYAAQGYDQSGNPVPVNVTWSVTGGAISAGGLYTPDKVGTYVVSAKFGAVTGSTNVTVVPGALSRIDVSPNGASITADQTLRYVAAGNDSKGNPVGVSPSWSSSGGSIDGTGLFTPQKVGKFVITASDKGRSGTADVTVIEGKPAILSVSPAEVPITADDTAQFTATMTDAKGNPLNASASWSVIGSAGSGSIDANGKYSPQKNGTFEIRASSSGLVASANVSVSPGKLAKISLDPTEGNITEGERLNFTVSGGDAKGNEIASLTLKWTVTGTIGTVDSRGSFIGTKPGTGKVNVEASDGKATLKASADMVVRARPVPPATVPGGDLFGNPLVLGLLLVAIIAAVAIAAIVVARRRRSSQPPTQYGPPPQWPPGRQPYPDQPQHDSQYDWQRDQWG